MIAGRMKYRIEILQPVAKANGFGEEAVTWRTVRTVWAERVKQSGTRSEELGEHFAYYDAQFNIRNAHPVKENWRVHQLGGNLYTVTNILPNIDKGMNTLVCEKVNE